MIPTIFQPRLIAGAFRMPDMSTERTPRLGELFERYEVAINVRTHRLFYALLTLQWALVITVTGIAAAHFPGLKPHVMIAIAGGALLVAPSFLLMSLAPQRAITRHIVAVSQCGFSGLIIYLTNGRIESHFHVFGSLAFLALYRDWKILPTASFVVLLHHTMGGIWFPDTTFCTVDVSPLRVFEHVGWVLFEVSVLSWACIESRREMWVICQREDENHRLLESVETQLRQRTAAYRTIQERTSALFRALPIGVFECSRSGEILLANEAMLRILGVEGSDTDNMEVKRALRLSPEDTKILWDKLNAEREMRGFETSLEDVNGRLTAVVISARIKRNAETGEETCDGCAEDVTDRKHAEREMERLNQQLMAASRQVGMAEAATGVLHNVGNVLTSVNLTVHDMQDRLSSSRISHLRRAADLIEQNQAHISDYIKSDPTGRQIPQFLVDLTKHIEGENQKLRDDMIGLAGHFEHIREIIVAQQSSARILGIMEDVKPEALVEDALRLTAESFERHRIHLRKDSEVVARVRADRHKVLQILVNLLSNAKDALLHLDKAGRQISVKISQPTPKTVAIAVTDNGVGIAEDNLTKIFQHGFTTKKNGHGFGLHSAALAAQEMRGDLIVASPGVGKGSTFTLILPITAKEIG